MQAELFCADLFEYGAIFESELATSVFVYATVTALLVNLAVAFALVRRNNTQNTRTCNVRQYPFSESMHNRREGPRWALPH